jgi:hypothetical protein
MPMSVHKGLPHLFQFELVKPKPAKPKAFTWADYTPTEKGENGEAAAPVAPHQVSPPSRFHLEPSTKQRR